MVLSNFVKGPSWEILENFERFNQVNDVFNRAFWDSQIATDQARDFFRSHREPLKKWRNASGFEQRDYAIRNAAWHVADVFAEMRDADDLRDGFLSPLSQLRAGPEEPFDLGNPEKVSTTIKQVSKLFGADLVGITTVDERWHYSHRVDTRKFEPVENDLPQDCMHVIVLGHSMKKELVDLYPAAVAGAATGMEYSREASIVTQMTSYIRSLGYQAIGSMNDTALAVPYAIKAGLGEYGRNQLVITPEFGPRVRFSKIFTNLPLTVDRPTKYGITEYCDICTKCADSCPPKALPYGKPSFATNSRSTIKGVKKWSANCEKCFGYWAKIKTDCAICMRVCPFNREFSGIARRSVR